MFYFKDNANVTIYFKNKLIVCPLSFPRALVLAEAAKRNDIEQVEIILNALEIFLKSNNPKIEDGKLKCGKYDITDALDIRISNFIKLLQAKGVVGDSLKKVMPFIRNMYANPFINAVEEIYDFCKAMDFEITEDGCFLAYKAVNSDLTSCYDNSTQHKIGEETSVEAFDTDRNQTCSKGLHFCSKGYLTNYPGKTIILVKVNPKDVVAIPTDYDYQKGRCKKYITVGILGDKSSLEEVHNEDLVDTKIVRVDWYKLAKKLHMPISEVKKQFRK